MASLSASRYRTRIENVFLFIAEPHALSRASLVAQTVKTLPVMQETQVQSLGQEDPLEKGMATPLQYSCLENPMDRGAW